ncbi:AMP-binding protein [Modestobacter sp. NPDC049651]|uniref:class I adenylate-forming enzyme family protein n=1 Tax=unclassified Modestobacter TaxID=2643866 RepID=UPI0033C2D8FD
MDAPTPPPGPATYLDDLLTQLHRAGDRAVLRADPTGTSGRDGDGRDTTGADLLAAVRRTARALAALGIGRGDLVALLAPNRPDALAVRYAAHLVGAGAVYLSAPPAEADRARLVRSLAPRLLVVWPQTARLLPGGTGVPVAAVGPVPGVALRLDELSAAQPATPLPSRARPADLAVVVSSGGTTGVPKGSRRDFARYTAMVAGPARPERRQLANGKLAYLTQVLVDQTLLGGGTVVLRDGFDAGDTLAAVEAERITDLFLVEPQLLELADHADLPRHDLRSLRAVTHVGADAAPVLRRRARARLGPVLAHTYGASEIGIVSALPPAEYDQPARLGSAGRVRPGVEVRFRRSDGSLDARTGAVEVRSPAMAQGYRTAEQGLTARFADGWYRTGDLGGLDDEGVLRVLGHVDDVLRLGGVAPVDLQEALCRLPAVRYAVALPGPHPGTGLAAVEPWPGERVDADACRAAVAAAVDRTVAGTLQVLPVERMPVTEQGKPDRAALLEHAGAHAPA